MKVRSISIKLLVLFEENKRRSNLRSLIDWREFFESSMKNSLLRKHSNEIASRTQQRLTLLTRNALHTMARNDEGKCKRRTVRRLHKFCFN
jgi:hypothetical protein